jgi:hypothetical protein
LLLTRIITKPPELCSLGQQLSYMKVSEHDIGSPLERFIVGSFESFSFDGWMKQAVNFSQEMRDIVAGDVTRIVLQQVINADKQIGDRVQPGEPGVLLEQLDQHFHGLHGSTHAFIGLLLRKNEGTVKPDEAFPHRQDSPATWIHGNKRRRVK